MSVMRSSGAAALRVTAMAFGLALASVMALTGCAQVPNAELGMPDSAHGLQDMATESDETPQRRRARLRLELGAGYLQDGQPQVALDEIKQAIAIDPAYADAFSLRGLVYLHMNNAELAADSFERALRLEPTNANTAHNLGLLRCQQSRFDEADKHFSLAATNADYAGQPRNWIAQALCHANAGKPLLAEAGLARALRLDAAEPTASYHLARLLFERGEAQAARAHLLKLNSSGASSAPSLWLGIRIEQRLNDTQAVRSLAEQLRARFGQSRELSAYDRGAFDE